MKVLISLTGILFLTSMSAYANVCVHAERANLRARPTTEASKTWEVYKFMPLQKVSEKKGWLQVRDVDGDTHWIQKRFTTNKFDCAVVKEKEARLRSGPGTRYQVVPGGQAKKYYSYRIVKREGQWLNVKDASGANAWIHRDSVWIQ